MNLRGKCRRNQQDIFNAMGSMYAAVLFIGVQNAATVQPVVAIERTVFYRERAAGMYSALPYAFGQVILLAPRSLIRSPFNGEHRRPHFVILRSLKRMMDDSCDFCTGFATHQIVLFGRLSLSSHTFSCRPSSMGL